MKKIILLTIIMISIGISSYGQTVLGGAGICSTDGDPDSNPDTEVQDVRYECMFAWDETNQIFYVYDDSQPLGQKWKDYSTINPSVDSDTRLDNPRLQGDTLLLFDIINALNANIIGTEEVLLSDLVKVKDIVAGDGIEVTDTNGVYTITNIANGDSITITGMNDVIVNTNYPDFTIDVDAEKSKGEYKNHADAGIGGVAIGEFFTASTDNTMGMSPGTKIKRKF